MELTEFDRKFSDYNREIEYGDIQNPWDLFNRINDFIFSRSMEHSLSSYEKSKGFELISNFFNRYRNDLASLQQIAKNKNSVILPSSMHAVITEAILKKDERVFPVIKSISDLASGDDGIGFQLSSIMTKVLENLEQVENLDKDFLIKFGKYVSNLAGMEEFTVNLVRSLIEKEDYDSVIKVISEMFYVNSPNLDILLDNLAPTEEKRKAAKELEPRKKLENLGAYIFGGDKNKFKKLLDECGRAVSIREHTINARMQLYDWAAKRHEEHSHSLPAYIGIFIASSIIAFIPFIVMLIDQFVINPKPKMSRDQYVNSHFNKYNETNNGNFKQKNKEEIDK